MYTPWFFGQGVRVIGDEEPAPRAIGRTNMLIRRTTEIATVDLAFRAITRGPVGMVFSPGNFLIRS